jgi:amino acid adenylation domain-containing protein
VPSPAIESLPSLPVHCDAITPHMLRLVSLDQQHIDWITRNVPGGVANIEDIYPLVPLQEGMLFHHAFNRRADTYVASTLFELPSQDELDVFVGAVQAVIDRHTALRTSVLWEGLPQPVQVVARHAKLSVEEIVLAAEKDPIVQFKERMRPDYQHLDVRSGPLLHLSLARDPQGSKRYALMRLHHMVSDRISFDVMISEIISHFRGTQSTLPPPVPYRNHVEKILSFDGRKRAESYFRRRLGTINEPVAPFGLTDVHGDGNSIEEACQKIDAALAWRLRAEAKRLRISIATLFHAAWALVVSQTTGKAEVVFGTVLSGRMQGSVGVQRAVGLFINTLPLRLQLEGLTVRELVFQTQRELTELIGFEHFDLTAAQRCSGISGSAPLFSSLLTYTQSVAKGDIAQDVVGSELRILATKWRTNYPIALLVEDCDEEIIVTAQTDQSVNPSRIIGYMHTALQQVADSLSISQDIPALGLSVVPYDEQPQATALFGPIRSEIKTSTLIHNIFEHRVTKSPDVEAVVCENKRLTYSELNARANQLARYLRDRLDIDEQGVALFLERSVEMIVGILAVWKAGGTYIPLDPEHPDDRLEYILSDAKPCAILTQDHLRSRVARTASEVISLDGGWEKIALHNRENLSDRPDRTSSRLAYIIYTSGSTGRPKGVMVEHRNVVSHWRSIDHLYSDRGDCRRIGVNAAFGFDASIQQMVQLLSGRTLILVPLASRWDGTRLLDFLEKNGIEGIDCTPSQLKTWLLAGLLQRDTIVLRRVLVGGEAIDAALWRTLAGSASTIFYNVYGPTECTVDATGARIGDFVEAPCLGRPLANALTYIIDRFGRRAPVGVVGEIFIGGECVGRGYLNQPTLTAERFVPDPFNLTASGRLYKTGDLARYRADGTIEYLGRSDSQVKLRGYRIELGEIESRLLEHPRVKDAAVVLIEGAPGDKRLVAYISERVVAFGGASAEHDDDIVELLRVHLSARIPGYMVPGMFVILPKLPMTPSGKIDRRALPPPGSVLSTTSKYEAPQGEYEEAVAEIWRKLLNIERVGRWDDFFDLGGHSILATRMVYYIRKQLGVEFPLEAIFSHSTIASIVDCLNRTSHIVEESGRIPLKSAVAGHQVIGFPPTSLGLGTRFRSLAECLDIDAAAYTCRLLGLLPGETSLATMEELARHCLRQFNFSGDERRWSLVGWSFSGFLAYEMAAQMSRSGVHIHRLVLIDTYIPRGETLRHVCDDDVALQDAFYKTMGVSGIDTRFKWHSVRQMFKTNLVAMNRYLKRMESYLGTVVEIRAEQSVKEGRYDSAVESILPTPPHRIEILPGDHYSIMSESNRDRLGAAISDALR